MKIFCVYNVLCVLCVCVCVCLFIIPPPFLFRVVKGDCEDVFSDCPSDESNAQVSVRTVLDFSGSDSTGVNQALGVTQYWRFPGDYSCRADWTAGYRFYSSSSECSTNIVVNGCDRDCDDGTPEGFRDMVCDRDNLPLETELSDATFLSYSCNAVDLQEGGVSYSKGSGFDPEDDDSDSGALSLGPSMFVMMVVALLGRFF